MTASRTITDPPGGMPILVGWALSAVGDTGSASPNERRPESSAEKVR